ncbi:hypothetical protein JCM11491_003592 [Sporobolomyces phaffii]
MAAPFDLTYEAPLAPVPAWLSYQISPTATVVLPFTVQTLAADGEPTAIIGLATVTRYETDLLQLPVTVSLASVASGQQQISLGPDYTTAGGDGPTIARIYGGTQLVTLGTSDQGSEVSNSPTQTATRENTDSITSTIQMTTSARSSVIICCVGAYKYLPRRGIFSRLSNVERFIFDIVRTSSTSVPTPDSASSPLSSTTSAPLTPNRLNSLTPSQLAAAIAAPISFFFLVVFLSLLVCCCLRRRRRRNRQEDNMFEGGLAGGGGSWGTRNRRTTREPSVDWDWVEPRLVDSRRAGSRSGGIFTRNEMAEGSRTGTPLSSSRGRGVEGLGRAGEGEASLLAGGGRYAHESPQYDDERIRGDDDDEEEYEDDGGGEIGASMMSREGRGRKQAAALGLGIASSAGSRPGGGRGPTSIPERAAATINAGLRKISGGRLGSSPEPEAYAYAPVQGSTTDLDLPSQEMVQRPSGPYWDPYKPSPTTPEFPILAPVISATSSDEPSRPNETGDYSGVSTSPDTDDIHRANLGLATLTNGSRWSEGGSPRTDETHSYDDDGEGDDEAELESTEMLASSREDAAPVRRKGPRMIEEGNWLSGRPPPLRPPLLRVPSDLSMSQYSQSDAGPGQSRSDQGLWLATPRFDDGNRSRENSGGSVASDLSLGNDKLSLKDLFFTAPRWTGSRNPNSFPTSTIPPIVPSGLVGPAGNLTPPPSSSSSSGSSSRYADAPISQPNSSTTRASFHTPRLGGHSPSFASRRGEGGYEITEDSPLVYSVVPTPTARSTRRGRDPSGRPDSEEVLERVAKSYERERGGGGDPGAKRRKRIDEEWKEIRLVGEEPFRNQYDAPFSNLTPLSSPLLPASATPPEAASRSSSSSMKGDLRPPSLLSGQPRRSGSSDL